MVFRHRATGSGQVIETMNPIYSYGVDTGNPKPPMTDSYPADKWTGVLPSPKGEKPRYYDDRTPPNFSESGSNFPFKPGKHEVPSIERGPRGQTAPLNRGVPQGIPNRNRFTQGLGFGGGNDGSAKRDPGVPYTDSKGRTAYRGKSG